MVNLPLSALMKGDKDIENMPIINANIKNRIISLYNRKTVNQILADRISGISKYKMQCSIDEKLEARRFDLHPYLLVQVDNNMIDEWLRTKTISSHMTHQCVKILHS